MRAGLPHRSVQLSLRPPRRISSNASPAGNRLLIWCAGVWCFIQTVLLEDLGTIKLPSLLQNWLCQH